MKDFLTLAKDRFSARKLAQDDIPEEDIQKILQAGVCAPTAVNNQPFKIWVIKSGEAREKLLSCTKMKFIGSAPVIFVVGAKADEAWVRPFDGKNFAEIDASIVAAHMMLEIHDLGYGSTWIGHFDPEKVHELFPETQGYDLVALLPAAKMTEDCIPSERHEKTRPLDEIVAEI